MKNAFLLFACALVFASAAAAQSRLPLLGEIQDLKGKTKFFLIAGQDRKTILKILTGRKGGLAVVDTPEEADFFVEFTFTRRQLKLPPIYSTATRYRFFETGRLIVYYLRQGKKVIVYDQSAQKSDRIFVPATALAKDFLNELSKYGLAG